MNAGLAGGFDGATCVLRGIRSSVTSHTVNFSIRNDNQALYALGQSIAQELCALFGNGFVTGCAPYLTVSYGAGSDFNVMITPLSNLNLGWWMYTSGFAGITLPNIFEEILDHLHAVGGLFAGGEDPFDTSVYYVFNSNFTSVPSTYRTPQSCSTSLIPSPGAPDYMYLCSPAYDTYLLPNFGTSP